MDTLVDVTEHTSRADSIVERRWPAESGFASEAKSVLASLEPLLARAPELASEAILERLAEPERVVMFQVPWRTDDGTVLVNRGYRVQFNSALGPYKGGLRFHPDVSLDLFLSLAFEQTFKNSLTGLRLGGAKGGADFDPKGRSDAEVARFCSGFMAELQRHIGEEIDVPAGDIGVGSREIGYLFGAYKRLVGRFAPGALTGKGPGWGGSFVRREATGYGLVYFVREMLADRGDVLEGKRAVVSGAGNVAIYAMERLEQLGVSVLACSDRGGAVVDPDGIDVDTVKRIKERERGSLSGYVEARPRARYLPGAGVWAQPCDLALPCATQGEVDVRDARVLIANGVQVVAEGANLPCSADAINAFREAGVAFGPGKAANAGGVATSGLEMQQDAAQEAWTFEDVDARLQAIMRAIYRNSAEAAQRSGAPGDLLAGANMAGFERVARAMLDQGVV